MWKKFAEECRRCVRCKSDGLLDSKAFPVLMKETPRSTDILFILEAPNRDDTYNPRKRYLTVEPETDPSGRFFHDLFVNELRFSMQNLFVTNSVRCLPIRKNGKFPVTSLQQLNCAGILRSMIDLFNPIIVCPVGTKALIATNRISKHGYRKMANAVAKSTQWYDRILFPLYHTSGQARNPRNGRPEEDQRADWRGLRAAWKKAKAQPIT
jgi:uracil-DNA glycosylase family 4